MSDQWARQDLFRGAAEFYERFRPRYPIDFLASVAQRSASTDESVVLDLGCGTGQVALPLSAIVGRVVAVDPDREMLRVLQARVLESGISNVITVLGSDRDILDLGLASVDTVTMGSSFHWMDRRQTLADLDEIVVAGGHICLLAASDVSSMPEVSDLLAETRARYLGPGRRAGTTYYQHPRERHEEILAVSPFPRVEAISVVEERRLSVGDFVGLQLSFSYSTPDLLGGQLEEFVNDLTLALNRLRPSGYIDLRYRFDALIAGRLNGP